MRAVTNTILVLVILGGAFFGYSMGRIAGLIGGIVVGTLWAVLVLGGLFLIMDIADNVRAIRKQNESKA